MKFLPLSLPLLFSLTAAQSANATTCLHFKPQLAVNFTSSAVEDWQGYWYSEKLDGIRAYWSGKHLFTRQGNLIFAPDWFIEKLPPVALEGELWIGRNQFEQTAAAVMDKTPDDSAWEQVKFMVFDLPRSLDAFQKRYTQLKGLVQSVNAPHLRWVEHFPVASEAALMAKLEQVNDKGGEGLMLRKKEGIYQPGRSDNVLKLKVADDAEAEVIGYVDGKGKHQGRLGALVVKTADGKVFKIGTGFSDRQRENPPALGTLITYRFNGYTKNGIPKFARFMRVDATKQ